MPIDRLLWDENFEADGDLQLHSTPDAETISLSDSTECNLMNLWIDLGGEA